MRVRNMTEGKPLPLILSVALPLMLGNVFQQLYTVVDAQIVGRVNGVSALAALGAADWFNWLFLSVIQGLTEGFSIPIAQSFGAQNMTALRKHAGNGIFLAFVCCIVITATALLSLSPVLTLLGTPDTIRPMSTAYLTVLFSGLPIVMAYNLTASFLRTLGDGRSPLYSMIVASIVNISLDILFVAGFGWGVVGAALGTITAQLCAALFCLFRLSKVKFIRPSKADLKPDAACCKKLMKLAAPLSLQNGMIGVGGMIVQSIVNTLGVAFIAGYTATNKLYGVLDIAGISFGYAVATYTGQNLGARKPDRIKTGIRKAALTSIVLASLIGGLMFIIGHGVVSSFISGSPEQSAEAIRYACEFLYLLSATLPLLYILYIYRAALQGMGVTISTMVSGIIEFLMRTGAALLLPALIGYWGVFAAEALAWFGADVILITSYLRNLRKVEKQLLNDQS